MVVLAEALLGSCVTVEKVVQHGGDVDPGLEDVLGLLPVGVHLVGGEEGALDEDLDELVADRLADVAHEHAALVQAHKGDSV